ncbi:MAG: polysaccharide biosynthesis protein [Herbinix sp.]|nr:polysaccharide biosynthesis protein [Herbinix sp.]
MNLSKYRKAIVFIMDFIITAVVCTLLFILLPDSNGTDSIKFHLLLPHLILLIVCGTAAQSVFKTYNSLWRYAQSKEYLALLCGGFLGYSTFLILDHCIFKADLSVLFTMAAYSVSLLGMLLMRLFYRQYRKFHRKEKGRTPLVIIGAGEAGVKLHEEVCNNPNSIYSTVFFVDDSIEKIGKFIHGIPVKGPIHDLEKIFTGKEVGEIVIAMPSASPEKRKEILEICSILQCHVRVLPDTLTLLDTLEGNNLWNSVREVNIEELLGREPITLDDCEVKKLIYNRVVMVTGGGGSIGSELCRQIAKVYPKRIVILDIYENNAYEIQQELIKEYGEQLDLKVEIASIRDKKKMNQLFKYYRPDIVFHAAAHKHVPLMEECPGEAIKNNIFGTWNVVKAAERYGVKKFVLISTDKAVNPTNIMGASKRFCEMILQSRKNSSNTTFVAVRFGNVLGSNGSVIPLFQKQIKQGGPVTITDNRIVRFFMTIPEAAQLVLQAGAMANRAEVFVLDMGQPVKILDLAKNLIRLSGKEPYKDIDIIETGLRPGEKLYEELLMKSEELIATANHKIYIERQKEISKQEIYLKLRLLKDALKTESADVMKNTMKQVVPTYLDPDEVNRRAEDWEYEEAISREDKVYRMSVS